MENLSFTTQEMIAILATGARMALADGRTDQKEVRMVQIELNRFGVPEEHMEKLIDAAGEMNGVDALQIISEMEDAQKRYVCAYLGTMMAIDGDIDDEELGIWRMVSTVCELPDMTVKEAIDYMAN